MNATHMIAFAALCAATTLVGEPAEFPPYESDSFVPGVTDKATGFFRVVQKPDGRWWTIDPLGRGVVLLGVDHVTYQGFFSKSTGRSEYLDSNKRKYPDKEAWAKDTLARLKAWGFNTLGCSSDPVLAHRGMAYVYHIAFCSRICRSKDAERYIGRQTTPGSGFPNVFHPDFEAWCDEIARAKCAQRKDDQWLVGYFIDNELDWGRGGGPLDTGLFNMVAKLPDAHPAKRAQLAFLVERGIEGDVPASAKLDFLRIAAERYFAATTAAIRRADPNHLVMGVRFAGFRSAHEVVWELAGRYCDVVSFNSYPWVDLDCNEVRTSRLPGAERFDALSARIYEIAKRPLILTEWSFPALDSGLPCTSGAGQRFRTQTLRARASELCAKTLLSIPCMLGYSYFMWVDEPSAGMDGFSENSNYGLVNGQGEPYRELTDMFARVHREAGRLRMAGAVAPATVSPPVAVPADVARRRLAAGRGATFRRDGERYVVDNGAGLVLEGRVGGRSVFDRVRVDGVELGRFGGMLCCNVNGSLRWCDVSRVRSADWRDGALVVTGDGEKKSTRFAFTFSISPVPGRPWFLCELTEVENRGTTPIQIESLLFRQFADYAKDKFGDVSLHSVPKLWGLPMSDAWFRKTDGAHFGGCTCAPSVSEFKYVINPADGVSQHPDAMFRPPQLTTLAPGEVYRPAGTVWMVAAGGTSGGRAEWERTIEIIDRTVRKGEQE